VGLAVVGDDEEWDAQAGDVEGGQEVVELSVARPGEEREGERDADDRVSKAVLVLVEEHGDRSAGDDGFGQDECDQAFAAEQDEGTDGGAGDGEGGGGEEAPPEEDRDFEEARAVGGGFGGVFEGGE
jgi:hypothetical protein